jgi:hypothetical protein
MAINRYDVPAQDNYKNTYVPLPYEQIMGTVAARQAQLQREQDMMNKTYEDTSNLKYIPGTKDEGYIKDYIGKTSDIVNKYYGQDMSDPVIKAQMRREFSNITDKNRIQNVQSSHDAWSTNQKYKAELRAKGLYDAAIDEDPANAKFDSTSGVYQYMTPQYKDPMATADEYFKPIKASSLGNDGTYTYQGVDKNKIDSVVNAEWSNFANTVDGNNYVRKIAKENGLDPTDSKVRQQIATEYLRGRGYAAWTYKDKDGMVPQDKTGRSGSSSGLKVNPNYLSPTPEVASPTEGLLSNNKKYNASNVRAENESLISKIDEQQKLVDAAKKSGADPNSMLQQELSLQALKDKQAIFQNTIESATKVWDKQLQPSYDKAEEVLKKSAEIKGIPYATVKKEYDKYLTLLKFDQKLKGNGGIGEWIPDQKDAYKGVANIADVSVGVGSGIGAVLQNLATKVEMFPQIRQSLSEELGKVLKGEQSLGDGVRKAFGENKQLYEDYLKKPILDKESMWIGDKVRDDVVKYHNKITNLDAEKRTKVDQDIESYGPKGIEGTRILAPTMTQDETNQMFYLQDDKNGNIKKIINPMSTLTKELNANPEGFAIDQESSPVKAFNKDKNKEKIDLQSDIRTASRVEISQLEPKRNDDDSYDIYVDTYQKPKGGTELKSRRLRVRLNNSTQIQAAVDMLHTSGHRVEAERVADPRMELELKRQKDNPTIKIEAYQNDGQYTIKKTAGGWEIFDPENQPITDFDNKPVGTISSYNNVISYLYNVRASLKEKIYEQSQQNNQ